jgi:hypothetical protein
LSLGDAVFIGHDGGEAGEDAGEAVHGGAGFAFFGAGAGGELCVGAVGGELFFGDGHLFFPFYLSFRERFWHGFVAEFGGVGVKLLIRLGRNL